MGSAEGPHREQAHPKCLFHISALPLSPPEQTPSGPRAHRRSGGDARVGDAAEPELGRQTGHPSPPAEPGAPSPHPRSECSLQLAAPAGPGPRLAEPRPRRPSPGLRRPPFLPGHSPRAAGAATARRAHSHPSASSCRSSWSSERSAPRGEKKGPVSAPGTRRAAPAARPPDPAAPPRAETPRRDPAPAASRGGGGRAGAGRRRRRRPEDRGPRTRHLVVAPSSSVSRGSGATWSGASRGAGERAREGRQGGGTGRRGRARLRARGGPRARAWAAGGAAPGRWGRVGATGPGPRPASPGRFARLSGGRRSLLPPPSLPARPGGARSHPRPEAPSRRALRRARASCPPARDPAACARNPARAGPPAARPALLGHGPRPPPRRPRPFFAGSPFAAPRPLPRTARTSSAIRGPVEAEGPTLRVEEAPPPRAPGALAKWLVTKPRARLYLG